MRVKISITLPLDLLGEIDRIDASRSALLERAARQYLAHLAQAERWMRDAAILDTNAARLNREAEDVLGYQVDAMGDRYPVGKPGLIDGRKRTSAD